VAAVTGRLETERLVLEPLEPRHAAEMVAVLADPELYRHTGGVPPSDDDLRRRYEIQARGRSADGTALWFNWIVRERSTGAAAGFVQATVVVASGTADVAWVVGTAFQGRGYAREAAVAMVDRLCEDGVEHVTAHIHPDNVPSQRVAGALGLVSTRTVVDGEVRWEAP
jgi:RimJ/RimL family protein N-acetyltransferase